MWWITIHVLLLTNYLVADANFECQNVKKDVIFSRDYTGVLFDPYVIYQDQADEAYYDESGLAILLEKVNTKFNHLMIRFTDHKDYKQCPELVPIVAAKLNKMLDPNSTLSISIIYTSSTGNKNWKVGSEYAAYYKAEKEAFAEKISKLRNLIDLTNSIYFGTIDEIIYEPIVDINFDPLVAYRVFRNVFDGGNTTNYKFGLMLGISICTSQMWGYQEFFDRGLSSVYYRKLEKFPTISHNSVWTEVQEVIGLFESCISGWKNVSVQPKIAFVTSRPDTDGDDIVQFNSTVYYWQVIERWARQRNKLVIFNSAFDVFHNMEYDYGKTTSGWWRIVPNSSYSHPSQFKFEEKQCLSNPDHKLTPDTVNITYLKEPVKFNRNVGIFVKTFEFEMYLEDYQIRPCNETCFKEFIERLFSSFSFLIVQEFSVTVARGVAKYNLGRKRQMELLPVFRQSSKILDANEIAIEANRICPDTVKELVFQMSARINRLDPDDLYKRLKSDLNYMLEMKHSHSINLSLGVGIKSKEILDGERFRKIVNAGVFAAVDIVYVDMVVDLYHSKQNMERILLQYETAFEVCKLVIENHCKSVNASIKVGFITGWPKESGSSTLEEILPLVRFWEGVNSFGKNDKFIMGPGIESGLDVWRNGWWRIVENGSRQDQILEVDELDIRNKKEIASELAEEWLKNLPRRVENQFEIILGISIAICMFAIIIVIVIIALFILKRRMNSEILNGFIKGSGKEIIKIGMEESIAEFNWLYEKSVYEISKGKFKMENAEPLGKGEFGFVYSGSVERVDGKNVKVAVKTIKESFSTGLKGALTEIKLLTYIGNHKNIVEFVGAYTSELRRRKVLIFLELCELGSLQSYLRKHKPVDINGEVGKKGLDESLKYYMSKWALEIVTGMEYISSKKIVHLDLAARNVLLTSEKVAKISDFGLSRQLKKYDVYEKKEREALPWRWMSPEALALLRFSEKSDVWAFAVTLWEIYSLGEMPYEWAHRWAPDFLTKLEQGIRLERPRYMCKSNEVFGLMEKCWNKNKDERPSFAELKMLMSSMLLGSEI